MNQYPEQYDPAPQQQGYEQPYDQPYAQPNDPEQPAPPRPAPKKKLNRVQLGVIIAAVLFAVGAIVVMLMPSQSKYGTVEAGLLGAHYTGQGLIVRDETPYESESVTSIEYLASEGKAISRGMNICNVFSSGYSTKEMTTLQDDRDQIRDYQLKLIAEETAYDSKMDRVESDVLVRAKEVREILSGARGNLVNEETLLSAAITARQQYINSKYSTDQRLSRLLDDEQAQQQRIDSWTKQYVAVMDTIVSFYSDGYEYGLTMENYTTFTPAEVRKMINGTKPAGNTSKTKTTIYRTINDGTWAVLVLMDDTSWNPIVGQSYQLQLERFENTVVDATVDSFTRSGGELLVRLVVNASVEPVLYMRTCTVTLGDYVSTMKVPSRAIYSQDGMDGVVVTSGGQEYFVPVQVVYTSGSDSYVSPVTQGLLSEGMTVLLF